MIFFYKIGSLKKKKKPYLMHEAHVMRLVVIIDVEFTFFSNFSILN